IISRAGRQCFKIGLTFLSLALSVIKVNLAVADDLGDLALNDNGGRFIEADAEVLRIGLHQRRHVALAFALSEVLVDGDALEEAQAAFVAGIADVEVVEDAAPAEVLALDGGAGRGAPDDAAACEDVEHERERLGVLVAIDEAPLPATVEPEAGGFLECVEKLLTFDLGKRLPIEQSRLVSAGLPEGGGNRVALFEWRFRRRREDNDVRLPRAAGVFDNLLEKSVRHAAAAADDERAFFDNGRLHFGRGKVADAIEGGTAKSGQVLLLLSLQ